MRYIMMIVVNSARAFYRHNCMNMAAAISFYAILSLVPILFLVFSIIGFILGSKPWVLTRVAEFIMVSLPYLSESILKDIRGLIAKKNIFSWFGIIVLIWSAEFVIIAIKDAMNEIFGSGKTAGFFRTRVAVWGIFFLWNIVALVSVVITAAAEILKKMKIKAFGIDLSYYLAKSIIFEYFLPILLMVLAVAFVFKIMSGVYIRMSHAVLGSIIFSILWEIAKHVFAWYISNFSNFNKVYGSLGMIMILLLWIFYSAMIFLFSAEVIAAMRAGRQRM